MIAALFSFHFVISSRPPFFLSMFSFDHFH
jgi:hypothetical protein